jgi:U6 snRNA-associated Sm-like protein LSm4
MLPLSLLNQAQANGILVELKSGETFNGHLVNCDSWMNIILKEVIKTSVDGSEFWRLPEIYIRGNTIKYLRIPDEIVDQVKRDQAQQQKQYPPRKNQHSFKKGDRKDGGRDNKRNQRGGDKKFQKKKVQG